METPHNKYSKTTKTTMGKNKDIKDTDNKGKADDNIKDTFHTTMTTIMITTI